MTLLEKEVLMFNRNELDNLAAELNFIRDNMEKVVRLCTILEYIGTDTKLSQSLVLKGGTAINLLVMPIPRLSVDIDLDFTENCERAAMIRQRKTITERVQSYMFANGYRLMPNSKSPFSADSWVFQYTNAIGNLDNIKIEINYSMRCHLLPTEVRPIKLPLFAGVKVRTLDLVELYASKIKALLERGAARDLFDVHSMIQNNVIAESQKQLLRKSVVFYMAVGGNKKPDAEFSMQAIEQLQFKDIRATLLPVLKKGVFYDLDTVKH
ncbi:MAG: nucleotidyl transferase AbiEii/AbiGii toxin family protein, partial [Bacteroidales bacterium]|nr:nucleotidyl transferase AbiEii/AbiGii toxin family protein [Bacteroidales bacterium]